MNRAPYKNDVSISNHPVKVKEDYLLFLKCLIPIASNSVFNHMLRSIVLLLFFCLSLGHSLSFAQQFPGEDENIPYLITFGQDASRSWGDDDFSQTFFIAVPSTQTDPIYVRVFDPDVSGELDEAKGEFNTSTTFSVFGGKGAYSAPEAQTHFPEKNPSGTMLATKKFGNNSPYDEQWYTFGPFNPGEGEYDEALDSYVFKIIATGGPGDDGNIYKYYLSVRPDQNVRIQGANAFTYEYTFRLPNKPTICHIYPFVDSRVISVKQHNFDWDGDGTIRIVSVSRKGEKVAMSEDDRWAISQHELSEEEKNTSLDIQLIKSKDQNNNNVVFRITNQYGDNLPFYSVPIGGRPVYKAKIKLNKIQP